MVAMLSQRGDTDLCQREQIAPGQLVLHSDNGGSMKGATMLATLRSLGVMASLSRPASAMTIRIRSPCSRRLNIVPTIRSTHLWTSLPRAPGPRPSCSGTTTSIVTVRSASSPRPSATPVSIGRSCSGAAPSTRSLEPRTHYAERRNAKTGNASISLHLNPDQIDTKGDLNIESQNTIKKAALEQSIYATTSLTGVRNLP